jgi:hypothetical protein
MSKVKIIIRNIDKSDIEDAIKAAVSADEYYRKAMTQKDAVQFGKFKCHETDKGTIVVTYAKD